MLTCPMTWLQHTSASALKYKIQELILGRIIIPILYLNLFFSFSILKVEQKQVGEKGRLSKWPQAFATPLQRPAEFCFLCSVSALDLWELHLHLLVLFKTLYHIESGFLCIPTRKYKPIGGVLVLQLTLWVETPPPALLL